MRLLSPRRPSGFCKSEIAVVLTGLAAGGEHPLIDKARCRQQQAGGKRAQRNDVCAAGFGNVGRYRPEPCGKVEIAPAHGGNLAARRCAVKISRWTICANGYPISLAATSHQRHTRSPQGETGVQPSIDAVVATIIEDGPGQHPMLDDGSNRSTHRPVFGALVPDRHSVLHRARRQAGSSRCPLRIVPSSLSGRSGTTFGASFRLHAAVARRPPSCRRGARADHAKVTRVAIDERRVLFVTPGRDLPCCDNCIVAEFPARSATDCL